ncbi:acyltransferase family protein [Neobacillus niacini]|uniref:acyltransferase family protein n=1 Tax=Neobacillus niacini TaxID=86668 RepID=UPI00286646F9|nr:acyltransferase family protein [Neobacillus niacini]MDR6998396.1 fucose 4-O-acetylase-like acetyltransferase [Neobacillus niacini]
MASASKRNMFFDNAKFVLIFLVVFGHVISPLKKDDGFLFTLYTVIFLFHMPAFILISGYFAKGYRKKGYLLKTIKKILLPYIIFQIIYSIFYFISGQEKTFEIDFLHPHWSLWFLLSMFCWNVMLYLFARYRWYGFFISVILGIAIGYIDSIGSFLSLSRTFVFFPYFLLGFLLDKEMLTRLIRTKFSRPVGFAVILLIIVLFAIGFPKEAVPWLLGDTSYAHMGKEQFTDGLLRAGQYSLTLVVVFGFLALIPSNRFKLTKIGERTLYVYLFHGFILKSIQSFLPDESLNLVSDHYVLLIIFSLILCIGLGSYLIKKYTSPLVELDILSGSRQKGLTR